METEKIIMWAAIGIPTAIFIGFSIAALMKKIVVFRNGKDFALSLGTPILGIVTFVLCQKTGFSGGAAIAATICGIGAIACLAMTFVHAVQNNNPPFLGVCVGGYRIALATIAIPVGIVVIVIGILIAILGTSTTKVIGNEG